MEKKNINPTPYDFVQPGYKLNSQWPVFDLVSQRLADELGTALSDRLQVKMAGTSEPSIRCTQTQCLEMLGPTATIHELSIEPLQGGLWFCMDLSVVSAIVNSYFGGNAELMSLDRPRNLSRTEKRVMRHILDAVVSAAGGGWSTLININPVVVREIDVQRLRNTAIDSVMVSSHITLKVGEIDLSCNLVYPFETLSPISDQLKKENTVVSRPDEQFSQAMQRELLNCELDVKGVLAESKITLRTLLDLKAGDFIALRDVQTVSFKTHNMPLFDARVGLSNGRVSASVSRWHLPVTS